jgi:hypothetical protein
LAKYKTLPNYEILRPKLHIQFNSEGIYETNNDKEIDFLDSHSPFIERLDKPKKEVKEESPKSQAKIKPSKSK